MPISAAEISAIQYTIYRENLGRRTPVDGHENVVVEKATTYFDTLQTSPHTGESFNFEHRISAAEKHPFPYYNGKYVVVYTFWDQVNEPHPCEIVCRCN